MTNIDYCKQQIRIRATMTCLQWNESDIIAVDEPNFGTLVWLQRCNERYAMDENGNETTELIWDYPVSMEYFDNRNMLAEREGDYLKLTYLAPRILVTIPEVVFWITLQGEIRHK